jgi:hypothetical protein
VALCATYKKRRLTRLPITEGKLVLKALLLKSLDIKVKYLKKIFKKIGQIGFTVFEVVEDSQWKKGADQSKDYSLSHYPIPD